MKFRGEFRWELVEFKVVGVVVVITGVPIDDDREVDEPETNIEAAADVVEAMAVAEIGSGWLCVPSYVVINIDMSSAHLCT